MINSAQPISIVCYFPRKDRWCKLGEIPSEYSGTVDFIFGRGELHSLKKWPFSDWEAPTLASYNPYSNSIIQHIPKPSRLSVPLKWVLREIFVVNDHEIFAWVSERQAAEHRMRDIRTAQKYVSFLTRYKVEFNWWQKVTSFTHLDARKCVCIVAKDDFVYFIGGQERLRVRPDFGVRESTRRYKDVYRYNLCKHQWDKTANFLRLKLGMTGAACNGRIFIAGESLYSPQRETQCEVYSEKTNEWQVIASLNISLGILRSFKLLSADDQLYALVSGYYMWESPYTRVQCYDADKNQWIWKTEIPMPMHLNIRRDVKAYPARIFKGFLSSSQLKSYNPWSFSPSAWSTEVNEGKCVIM